MSRATQAFDLVKQADSKIKSLINLFGNKWEDAVEKYTKAANMFKMEKMWKESGDSFSKAAQCHVKLQSKGEAANAYSEAGNAYKNVSFDDANIAFQQATDLYIDMGRLSSAAKIEKEIGEMYEKAAEYEKALDHFNRAADIFLGENQASSANTCLLKVAHLAASIGDYNKGIENFERVANNSVDNNLLKFSVKEYVFKAMLLQLASVAEGKTIITTAQDAFERYKNLDIHFPDSREAGLIDEIFESWEHRDVEEFTGALRNYDRIVKLDNWKTNLLLKVKAAISGGIAPSMGGSGSGAGSGGGEGDELDMYS